MFCTTPLHHCCTALAVSLSMNFKLWRWKPECNLPRDSFRKQKRMALFWASISIDLLQITPVVCTVKAYVARRSPCTLVQEKAKEIERAVNTDNHRPASEVLISVWCQCIQTVIHLNLKSLWKRFPLQQKKRRRILSVLKSAESQVMKGAAIS